MKKILAIAAALLLLAATGALGWETKGIIPGTSIEYSDLAVTKRGLNVKLTNTGNYDVKVSSRIDFYDKNGTRIGYVLFGLREIPAGAFSELSNVHVSGPWKPCKDAFRMDWQRMTYEELY